MNNQAEPISEISKENIENDFQNTNSNIKHKLASYPSLKQSFGLVLLTILISLGVGIPIYIIKSSIGDQNAELSSFFDVLAYSITFLLIIVLALKNSKKAIPKFKLKWSKVNPITLMLLPIITLAFILISEPASSFIPMPEYFQKLFEEAFKLNFFGFFMIVIAAPILEEILFRGLILEGLLKRFSPKKAIFWSAFLFGLVHMNPWQFVGGMLAGLLMGWLYYKSKSLIPGILVHFFNNLIAFLIMLNADKFSGNIIEESSLMGMINDNTQYFLIYGLAIAVFGLSLKYINKLFNN